MTVRLAAFYPAARGQPTAPGRASRQRTLRSWRTGRKRLPGRLLAGLTAGVLLCAGAAAARANPPAPPLADLTRLLQGQWRCQGRFADGRTIQSSETFAPLLDGAWLLEQHEDAAPFTYRAQSLWGYDTGQQVLTLTIFDNFGGQRLFTSPGWREGLLTFEERALLGPPPRQERFRYRTLPAGAGYGVEYQVLAKTGQWRMGDTLECRHP
jgi:hypothetical protein